MPGSKIKNVAQMSQNRNSKTKSNPVAHAPRTETIVTLWLRHTLFGTRFQLLGNSANLLQEKVGIGDVRFFRRVATLHEALFFFGME